MKTILLFLLLSVPAFAQYAAFKNVQRDATTNRIDNSLVFGTGKTLRIETGATIDATGATITGFPTSTDGKTIIGSVNPTTEGNDGDVYENKLTGDIYTKASGAWTLQFTVMLANGNTTGYAGSLKSTSTSGLFRITGPASSTVRDKTVRDANDTLLEQGGSYTPTGTWNWASATATWPTFNQNTTGNAAKWTTARTLAITGDLAYTSGSLDGSANVTGTGTLATVNSNTGSFGTTLLVPQFTVNAKGLITAVANQTIPTMVGDAGAGGTKGFVPAPATGDATKFLKGDGTWGSPAGSGDFSSNTATSMDSEVVLFSGTGGKTGKRATGTGPAKLTSGVLSAAAIDLSGSEVTNNLPVTKLNSGTSASGTTFWRGDGTWATPAGGGTPAGSDTYVQYNDSTAFGANAGLTVDKTTGSLTHTRTGYPNNTVPTSGIALQNTTTATSSQRMHSPAARFIGHTYYSSADHTMEYKIYLNTNTGSGTSQLRFSSNVDGGAFTDRLTLDMSGELIPQSLTTGQFNVGVTDTTIARAAAGRIQVEGNDVFTSLITPVDTLDAAVFAADAGSNDTYIATLTPAITAYVTGTHYRFKANTSNTGAATINFNAIGAITIKKAAGGITTDLADNDIRVGQWVDLVYDGTNMQMQSLLGNAASGGGSTPTGTGFRHVTSGTEDGAAQLVGTADITDGTVALADMANLAQDQFIGRTTASTGVPQTTTITAAARTVLDDTTVGAMLTTLGGVVETWRGTFDGQGSVITAGVKSYRRVYTTGNITMTSTVGDVSGSITLTVKKYTPSGGVLGSPTTLGTFALASQQEDTDTGNTWAVTAGDVLEISSTATITSVTRVDWSLSR